MATATKVETPATDAPATDAPAKVKQTRKPRTCKMEASNFICNLPPRHEGPHADLAALVLWEVTVNVRPLSLGEATAPAGPDF